MSISLTPIERDLIERHLPLPEEKDEWKRRIEEIEGESERVEVVRMLSSVLDKNFGKVLEGVIKKKDSFERLNTLYMLLLFPENMRLPKSVVKKVINSQEHRKELYGMMLKNIKRIVPNLEEIKTVKALSNLDYVQNLFKYHAYFSKEENQRWLFQMIQKAYLERGVEGVKWFKYRSGYFKENLPDERVKSFVEKLDERLGEVLSSGGGGVDIFESLKGKFEDFENHSKHENIGVVEEAGRKVEEFKPKVEESLEKIGDSRLSREVRRLVEEKNVEGLEREVENLKSQKFQGVKERNRSFLIGVLSRLANLLNAQRLSDSVRIGRDVMEKLKTLEGKPVEEQEKILAEIRGEYGREKLERAASSLGAVGKSSLQDLRFFIGKVMEPIQREGGSVTSRVTHDVSELFTLGKFENNCQSPGAVQSPSLLGFTAHPSELTIGHYLNGEFIGFTFAHVLKSSKSNGYVILLERAYSNHDALKPLMQKNIEKIKEKINKIAKNERIPLKAVFKGEEKGKYRVLNSPGVSKYYDCYGGEVGGGETI